MHNQEPTLKAFFHLSSLFTTKGLGSKLTKFLSILLSSLLILTQLELSSFAAQGSSAFKSVSKPQGIASKLSKIKLSKTNPHQSTTLDTNTSLAKPIEKTKANVDPKLKLEQPKLKDNPDLENEPKPIEEPEPKIAPAQEGGGAPGTGMGTSVIQSVQNDPFTGRLSLSVPINVPPGRLGIQPKVSLNYTSNQANSIIAVGWTLNLPRISRSTKKGRPSYCNQEACPDPQERGGDTFIFEQDGSSQELVLINPAPGARDGASLYRPKLEGSFTKFEFQNNTWVLTDKTGIKYYLGNTQDSKISSPTVGPNQTPGTYAWYINKVEDLFGNYVTFSYTHHENQIYPQTITYTKNDSNRQLLLNTLSFELEPRPDKRINYRSGIKITTEKRISNITVRTNNPAPGARDGASQQVRRYHLNYTQSPSNQQTLLTSITQYGSDDQTTLPPVVFEYQENDKRFGEVEPWPGVEAEDASHDWRSSRAMAGDRTVYVETIDINGDGLPDRVMRGRDPFNYFKVQLNNGSGFDQMNHWETISASANGSDWRSIRAMGGGTYTFVELLDINGDGLLDRVMEGRPPDYDHFQVQINNGSGFNAVEPWPGVDSENNGADWREPRSTISGYAYVDILDINGDGLPDRVMQGQSYDYFQVQLNNGSGFGPIDRWEGVDALANGHDWRSTRASGSNQTYVDIFDINGDGLPDRVMQPPGQPYDHFDVQLNNGSGFDPIERWEFPFGEGDDPGADWNAIRAMGGATYTYVDILDINGDGLPDRVLSAHNRPYDHFQVQINNGSGFDAVTRWDGLPPRGFDDESIRASITDRTYVDLFDINGDGLPDRVLEAEGNEYNHYNIQLNLSPTPNLISSVSNGLGGEVTVNYTSSTQFDNTGDDDLSDLPFPVMVVDSITSTDGRGSSYTTGYSYKGGKYDTTEREFRGFAEVTVTDPDSNPAPARRGGTSYTKTYFHQDNILKGRPFKAESYSAEDRLLTKSESTWQSEELPAANNQTSHFVYLEQADNYVYLNEVGQDGNPQCKHTCTTYTYDDYGNQEQVDNLGDVTVNNDQKQETTEYTYNLNRHIIATPKHKTFFDSNANKEAESWIYYDQNDSPDDLPQTGLLTKQEGWLKNPLSNATARINKQAGYNNLGLLTTSTNPKGEVTTTIYEQNYQTYPATTTNTLNQTVTTTYDPKTGQVLTTTDPNQQTTTNIYDNLGRLIKVVGPLDTEDNPGVIYEYYLDQFPVKVVKKTKKEYLNQYDPNNYLTVVSYYDGLGRLIQTKTPAQADPDHPNQARFIISGTVVFDQRGKVHQKYMPYYSFDPQTQFSEPELVSPHVTIDYDALGRVIRTTNPDNTSSTIEYNGFTKTITDEENNVIVQHLDAYARLIQVDEHNPAPARRGGASPDEVYTTRYVYDAKDNLIQITDHEGNVTTITYDSFGRKLQMNDPDMGTWSYTYDNNGNLISQTDAKGQTIRFEYDQLNRLISKDLRISKDEYQTIATYTYDDPEKENSVGRLSRVTYTAGLTDFYYDILGREIRTTKTINNNNYTVQRTYNAMDQLKTLTYPDQTVLTYTYDPNTSQIVSISSTPPNNGGAVTNYVTAVQYSQTGQIERIVYGNGDTRVYTYNPLTYRLEHLSTNNGQLQDLNYTFDNLGNITNITDTVHTNTQSFRYDSLSRLIHAQGASYGTIDYRYDAIGNMTEKTHNDETINYFSGPSEQEFAEVESPHVGPHALRSASNGLNFSYDDNGNMTKRKNDNTDELTSYEYDSQNRLIRVNLTQQEAPEGGLVRVRFEDGREAIMFQQARSLGETSFTYDPDGGRTQKIVSNQDGQEQTTTYIGNLYETTQNQDDSTVTKHIFLGSNRIASIEENNDNQIQTSYFHTDHLGSSNIITNQEGDLVQLCEYQPYGTTSTEEGGNLTNYKFTGKELDDSTGLYFYSSRYYDASIARFTQPDTIVPDPADPQSLNRYSYCRNNPVKYIDPSGHLFWVVAAIIGAVIGAAAAAITGSNIWQGALIGAIGGLMFHGVGTLKLVGLGQTLAHGYAGAAVGAIGGAIEGGDVGRGALIGMFSAGLSSGLSQTFNGLVSSANTIAGHAQNFITRSAMGAVTGGAASAAFGGSFENGARLGGMTAGIAYATNCALTKAAELIETGSDDKSNLQQSIDTERRETRTSTNLNKGVFNGAIGRMNQGLGIDINNKYFDSTRYWSKYTYNLAGSSKGILVGVITTVVAPPPWSIAAGALTVSASFGLALDAYKDAWVPVYGEKSHSDSAVIENNNGDK